MAVAHGGNKIIFTLPDKQGEFRGRLDGAAHEIVGQWIQPPGITNNNAYATPVTLKPSQERVWQGDVRPLEDRLTLYLEITRVPDGTLNAFIRNPEFNFGHGGPYKITGDIAHLRVGSAPDAEDQITGSYDAVQDLLFMRFPGISQTFDFTRRDRNDALGFYPVTPAQSYIYRQPLDENDGWATASLRSAGLSAESLQSLIQKIFETTYTGPHTPYIQSLLIARHGKLVLEQYFYGYNRNRTHTTRSAGKTFAGVLVGIALDQGAKFTLNTPVLSLFPEYRDVVNMDSRKRAMTVRDLLTMTSGLSCDDNNDNSPGNEDRMQQQHEQRDWYKYTLDLPMARNPGGDQAVYCSAGVNLLGGIVQNTTGMQLPEFFYRYYAQPLDIGVYHMNLMPTGQGYMGGGIEMRPRDQLKLGQLFLDGGVWNGRRVISAAWVKASWQVSSAFAQDHHYGYTWHIIDVKAGDKTYRLYEAGGNGGQFTIAIPELDMVVGFTAGNYGDFPVWYRFMTELVPQYIIPAAVGP